MLVSRLTKLPQKAFRNSGLLLHWSFAKVHARWYSGRNFGDALNRWLIQRISGATPCNIASGRLVSFVHKISHKPDFVVVGSILHLCGPHSIVWGPGFISERSTVNHAPRRILAVRGPLTRKKRGWRLKNLWML